MELSSNASINNTRASSPTSINKRRKHRSNPSNNNHPKNSSANSVVSLVCAIIPIILYSVYFIHILSRPVSGTDQSGWILVIYYWTVGFPLALAWLICGILGLKSKKRKMAIASLAIKPIGLVVFILLMLIRYTS